MQDHLFGGDQAPTRGHRQFGLKFTGAEEFTVDVGVVDDPAAISTCEGLIYAVKAQNTPPVLKATAHIEAQCFVASLKNGVEKDDALAQLSAESAYRVGGNRPRGKGRENQASCISHSMGSPGSASLTVRRRSESTTLLTVYCRWPNTESTDQITRLHGPRCSDGYHRPVRHLGRRTNAEICLTRHRPVVRDIVRELATLARKAS
ncbi:MAG: hypothetical protein Ct9H300mP12_12550 [Acidimicrobiales bacterium]|nr:MAG: hypothetical protein Ct9H300mP12_12550 [Acidimicrobiales bacterium]